MSEMETDGKEVLEIQQDKKSCMCLFACEGWKHESACQLSQIMRVLGRWLAPVLGRLFTWIRGANPADVAASPAHSPHVTW